MTQHYIQTLTVCLHNYSKLGLTLDHVLNRVVNNKHTNFLECLF